MEGSKALSVFREYLARLGFCESALTPSQALEAMAFFYRTERAEGCLLEYDADMLLFQWGCYDRGKGEHFEFDITRQLIFDSDAADENIWQLSLTLHYTPVEGMRTIGKGNRWCHTPTELKEFERFVRNSPAYKEATAARCEEVELTFFNAG